MAIHKDERTSHVAGLLRVGTYRRDDDRRFFRCYVTEVGRPGFPMFHTACAEPMLIDDFGNLRFVQTMPERRTHE